MGWKATLLLCLVVFLFAAACGSSDDDDDDTVDRTADDDDDDGSFPDDDDTGDDDDDDDDDDTDASGYSGQWTGTMDITFETGQGGGTASILLILEVTAAGKATGTITDPTCAQDPACPDHVPIVGTINAKQGTAVFSWIFANGADGITYHYAMSGEAETDHLWGTFSTLDDEDVPQSHGTWDVTK